MSTNEVLRLVTIALSAAGIIVMVLVSIKYRDQWLYTVPVFIYLISALGLSLAGLLLPKPISLETAEILNSASYVVRLESLITLIAAGAIFLRWRIRR